MDTQLTTQNKQSAGDSIFPDIGSSRWGVGEPLPASALRFADFLKQQPHNANDAFGIKGIFVPSDLVDVADATDSFDDLWNYIVAALPDGAQLSGYALVRGLRNGEYSNEYWACISSKDFETLEDGGAIPTFEINYEAFRKT